MSVQRPSRLGAFVAALSCAFFVALAFASEARAEPRDPVAAEALFDRGRELMNARTYADACRAFEGSQRLDPGVGTLLNLGDCYEKLGRVASAWATFREAASAAVSASQPEREAIARKRAAALEGRLARVTLRVRDEEATDDLALSRDGVPIDRAAWGTAVPVDPGEHAFEAVRPGRRPWHAVVTIPASPVTSMVVDVPALESVVAPPAAKPFAIAMPPLLPEEKRPEETRRFGVQRGVAIGTGGLGVVALLIAGGFALSARSTYSNAQMHCTSAGCDPDGVRMGHDAGSSADVATVSVLVGGVALAAATVLWLTAK